ncbi:hypothetical protein K461DRAFT_218841 [Myriangium duriaei CBS 260.36]|uniref:EamA domain-containing protein n=1 Tax=Myriangium duriaei CBS 260.36 TaxID=1168546 RepID=A0A9P4MKT7_9PEZI|nr:hypothetical protein K461DRAFT_218841 [Myriangium duriaei CBS 260.36]
MEAREEQTTRTVRHERWRRTLGLILLFTVVVLWTASNFLASTLFADDTYDKPFLVTYVNTSCFILPLLPMLLRHIYHDPSSVRRVLTSVRRRASYVPVPSDTDDTNKPSSPLLGGPSSNPVPTSPLTFRATARLALEFCILWYLANYFVASCLSYTTVASSTILTSTSSVFTLLFGTLARVERFSLRKLLAVLASLAGIVLISSVDLSGRSDEGRGKFPHKTPAEIGLGDAMALLSAVLYGLYAVRMKARLHDESLVSMPLFFGLVGLFNTLLLWPGFFILHFAGVEKFALPPTGRVTTIIAVNSLSSLVSDFAWAYAVLLTSPIVVTVGLSTTIPLSLIGQVVINGQTAPLVYWLGAGVVVASFVVVEGAEEVAETHGVANPGRAVREGDEEGVQS